MKLKVTTISHCESNYPATFCRRISSPVLLTKRKPLTVFYPTLACLMFLCHGRTGNLRSCVATELPHSYSVYRRSVAFVSWCFSWVAAEHAQYMMNQNTASSKQTADV
jgi:hypothetical protein